MNSYFDHYMVSLEMKIFFQKILKTHLSIVWILGLEFTPIF